jgi:flagellin
VTAEARTTATIGSLSANGTVAFTLQGTNASSALVNINATVTTTDLSSLAQAINDQAGNTSISAVLSSDKATITLTQATGYDIKIGNFTHSAAGVAGTTATIAVTGGEGTATKLTDVAGANATAETAANAANTDSTVVGGNVSFSSIGTFNVSSTKIAANGSLFSNTVAGTANTSTLSSIDAVDISTVDNAASAIKAIDGALSQVDNIRGDLGAIQNRFESTIANLSNVSENLSAARSRIMDADIAQETSAMTKNNILQQAGVAILAQANQAPQLALSLLK